MAIKTNDELVKHIMNFSKYGALSQAFVMQAIEAQCDCVINCEEELISQQEIDEKNGRIPFINIHAWIGVAKEIKSEFDKRRIEDIQNLQNKIDYDDE